MKPNLDLRFYAQKHRVPLWKVAKAMGISEPTIIRRLREEFTDAQKAEFMRAVISIKTEEGR
ncbi:MAG TPA: hypothetical protein PKL77_11585 [Candidatus Omnitrophota bacterium]|nr:hypothetical protein [Candidatus Omnitrophota bacterium]